MDGNPQELKEAYRYCQWVTYHHYENFPVASWILPKEKRPYVSAIYAFARSADDFADEARYKGRSLELLDLWRQTLWACVNGEGAYSVQRTAYSEDHPIFIALGDAIRKCDLSAQLCDDLLTAFTMDVTKRRYANWEELLTYCRYSANPVGRLVLQIFGLRDEKLSELSDHICTGLQLANHWQDLRIDLKKDRLYIPQTLLRQHGVSEGSLFRHEVSPQFQALMQELVRRAGELFDRGEPLLRQVSGRLRLELKLTVLGGRAILDQTQAIQYDVFRRHPVLSLLKKLNLLTHALLP